MRLLASPIVLARTNTMLIRVLLIVYYKCMHLIILFNSSCLFTPLSKFLCHSTFAERHAYMLSAAA